MDRDRNLKKADLVRLVGDAEKALAASAGDEAQRLVHDLHLHQIELEIQNQDLRTAQAALEAARDDYTELYDFAPVGYLSLDQNGLIQKLNLTAAKLLGRERANLLHKPFTNVLTKGSSNRLFKHLRAAFAQGAAISDEFVLMADGDRPAREIRLDSRPHRDQEGEPRCLTTVTDISDTKRLERELRASHQQLATLLAAAPVGIGIVEKHVFQSMNAHFAEMLGYTEQALLGEHARKVLVRALAETRRNLELALEGGDIGTYSADFPFGKLDIDARSLSMFGYVPGDLDLDWDTYLSIIHAEDRPAVVAQALTLLRGERERFEAEYRIRHLQGHWVWILDRAHVVERDTSGTHLHLAGTHIDVTRRREAERQVLRLVEHDELTGLLNRRGVLGSIRRIHASAVRSGQPYCLAILDLDHFNQVNDAYGHPVGDEVLRPVAKSLT